jgi:hypothetical protein
MASSTSDAIKTFGIVAALKHNKGRTTEVAPPLIAELLDQIRPRPDCEAACREKLLKYVTTIKNIKEVFDKTPSTTIKTQLEKFRSALKKVSGATLQLSPIARRLLFNELEYESLCEELGRLIEDAEITCSLISTKTTGSMPKLQSKMVAAAFAHDLIKSYSPRPPTLTKGGKFFRLADLLYEAATGECADLTRYCRARL